MILPLTTLLQTHLLAVPRRSYFLHKATQMTQMITYAEYWRTFNYHDTNRFTDLYRPASGHRSDDDGFDLLC